MVGIRSPVTGLSLNCNCIFTKSAGIQTCYTLDATNNILDCGQQNVGIRGYHVFVGSKVTDATGRTLFNV